MNKFVLCVLVLIYLCCGQAQAQNCRGTGPVRKVVGGALNVTENVAGAGVATARAWNCKIRRGVKNTVNRVRSWGSNGSSYGCTGSSSYGCTGSSSLSGCTSGCENAAPAPAAENGSSVVIPLAPVINDCPNGQCPQNFQGEVRIKLKIRAILAPTASPTAVVFAPAQSIMVNKQRVRIVYRQQANCG